MLEELKNLKALLNENIEKIELLNKENKDIEIKQIFINESLDILKKDLDFINEEEKDSKILSKYLNIALSISIVLSVFFLNMLFSLLLFLMGLFIKLIYNKLYKEDYLNYLKDLIPVILENIDQNEKEAMINKHKYEQNTENLKKLLNNQSSIESKINELVGATTYKNNFNSEEYFTKEVDDSKCDEMPQLKKTKSIPNSD